VALSAAPSLSSIWLAHANASRSAVPGNTIFCVGLYIYIYIYVCVCVCVCIYVYIYVYIYSPTRTTSYATQRVRRSYRLKPRGQLSRNLLSVAVHSGYICPPTSVPMRKRPLPFLLWWCISCRCEPLILGLGPHSGVSIGRLSGVAAVWDCVSRVCGGGGGCAGGGVPLGAVPVLS